MNPAREPNLAASNLADEHDYLALIHARLADYERRFAKYNRRRGAVVRWWLKHYHRFKVRGIENVPDGPALLAANHGGGFDLDIMALGECCHPTRPIQPLIDVSWHFVNHWWGRYFIGRGIPLWTRGGIRWEFIDPYLQAGGARYPGLVAIYPEGHSGVFRQRRTLWPFFPGVVRIALRYRAPIVPVGLVGFHYAAPILHEIKRDHGPNNIVFLPFAFPAKLHAVFGKPFELSEFYGQTLTRDEEFRVANDVVRPRVAELLREFGPVELAPAEGLGSSARK
jgi:1-acyl-sn-glycerol-3-phosphate acyltransferase